MSGVALPLRVRPSTSAFRPKPVLSAAAGGVEGLGTNEIRARHGAGGIGAGLNHPFVPSEVEGRWHRVDAEGGA